MYIQESSEINLSPFIDKLMPSKMLGAERFYELEEHPNKLIRVESFEKLTSRYRGEIEAEKLVQITNSLYKELDTKYAITAPAHFLIGNDSNQDKVVYSVVDKIDGKMLKEVTPTEESVTAVENLYTSIANYFLNKSVEGGFYLCDINSSSQYMYGKKEGDLVDKLYLIDTDIYISDSRTGLYLVVEWLSRHIVGTEQHFNIKLDKPRQLLTTFVENGLPSTMSESEKSEIDVHIEAFKKFLNMEPLEMVQKRQYPHYINSLP